MKQLFLLVLLCLPFGAFADQRFESHQGICHFAYDADDPDNEVYFSNCVNTINTAITPFTQGVRYAFGTSLSEQDYTLVYNTHPYTQGAKLKGSEASPIRFPDSEYTLAVNTPCVMVTSNYDAANDDDNETVYVTNDWNFELIVGSLNLNTQTMRYTYVLNCRKGVAQ